MKGLRFFLFACALIAGLSVSSLWRDRQNTLEKYPEWKSAKADLAQGVNGARSFTLTPISLLGRSLNLGAWHGHQEVAFQDMWPEFPEVKLRIFAEGAAEWSLIANSTQGQQNFAFRLSNHRIHPSAWIKLGEESIFAGMAPIDFRLPESRWLTIELRRKGARLEAFADQAKIGMLEYPVGKWRLSLRAHSRAGVLRVDDVFFLAKGKNYTQKFSGEFPYALCALLVFLLSGILLLIEVSSGRLIAASLALAVAFFSGLVFLFYDSHIGNQYPYQVDFRGYPSHIETRDDALLRLQSLPSGKPVLLWLGGSQAWGAGASVPEKSVFGRLSALLSTGSLDFVNGAISGATLEDQMEALRIVSSRRVVAAVVVTAAVNDANNSDFLAKLNLISSAVKQRGAKLMLVPEPTESPVPPYVKLRQEEIRQFAWANNISMVDLPAILEQAADSGYLWWDFVHLSDAGASIAARALAPPLQLLIEQKTKR